jgi:sulfoxide reductase catalytic subunit YedY
MSFRKPFSTPPSSEITPESVYLKRRQIMQASAAVAAGLAFPLSGSLAHAATNPSPSGLAILPSTLNKAYAVTDAVTPEKDATTYNNFYEFGFDKSDPAQYSKGMKTSPWTVSVEGEVAKPQQFDMESLLKLSPMQERIYRLRCVEGWSMVIPWVGYSLSDLLKQVEPTSKAKYVEFITDMQPDVMRGLNSRVLDWPYREGLRIDEAMNPLTLLTFGMYGKVLPNQNGAPVRIIVPWKYGFKSGKSIVKIRLTEKEPVSSWMASAPFEYGFYANVNPNVSHPRWSQATERRIGEDGFFTRKRETLMFNGYENEVASLYAGMDLKKNF